MRTTQQHGGQATRCWDEQGPAHTGRIRSAGHTKVDYLHHGVLEVQVPAHSAASPLLPLALHLLREVPVVRDDVVLRAHQQHVLVLDVRVRPRQPRVPRGGGAPLGFPFASSWWRVWER